MIVSAILEEVRAYEPEGLREREAREKILELLRQAPDPFTRRCRDHVTGSAVVARPDGSAFVLVFHRRLRRWLQPGGHVEPADASVLETAKREAREETGIASLDVAGGGQILDLDVHPIPATADRPEHVHYDLRYLLTASGEAALAEPAEIEKVGWFTFDEAIAAGADPSVQRALRKARARLGVRSPSA
jgi:8-oxo-dGTP pyrophosphatase MutT (NUDIX family)